MPLAADGRLVARLPQRLRQRPLLQRQAPRRAGPHDGVDAGARDSGRSSGPTRRRAHRLHVERLQHRARPGQLVEVRRLDVLAADEARVGIAQVVGEDVEDVGFARFRRSQRRCRIWRTFCDSPRSTLRTDPLELAHPVDITVSSVWLLPEEWSLHIENERVEDAVFNFERRVSLEENKRKIVETDHFVSRADFVAGADAPRYAANLEKARQVLGITLFRRDAGVEAEVPATPSLGLMERFNWSIAMLAVLLLLNDALDAAKNKEVRDSIKAISEDYAKRKTISVSKQE